MDFGHVMQNANKGKTREDEDHAQRGTFIGLILRAKRNGTNRSRVELGGELLAVATSIQEGKTREDEDHAQRGTFIGLILRAKRNGTNRSRVELGIEVEGGLSGCSGGFRGLMEAPCLRYPVISLVAGS
ncbi:hypothetical protein Glove_340g44 [Diversispora epigaea]|uniref:Uncharacterized protein n=1 Tax=Diversispora epigaea TaxID=1348612 RepID=A0A397HHG5_9GLOM|nr:hypothetical protein Glove_340g44 [Diversispora epigaea]